MNRYAIYHVDGVHEGLELLEVVETESPEEAETIAYQDGCDCAGYCYEEYDEEDPDAWEPDCNCHYKIELVAPDSIIKDGIIYSEYDQYMSKINRLQNTLMRYPTEIEEARLMIQALEKKNIERIEKLKKAADSYPELYAEAMEYIKKMNGEA